LGTLLNLRGFLSVNFFTQLNRLSFYILLPALLFHKITTAARESLAPAMWIGIMLCVCSIIITIAALLWGRWMKLSAPSLRSLMQASMRGNIAYSGLPIVLFMFGADSEAAQLAVLGLIPSVPFYNFLAVIILTPRQGAGHLTRMRRTAESILRNPLIISCVLGLICMLTQIKIPEPVMRAITNLGQAALPCALLSLGSGLSFKTINAQLKPAAAATLLKLIAMPLVGYALIRLLNIRDDQFLVISMIYLASPAAVTSYVMAEQMGADKELAASVVTLSTLCAMPVLAIILLIFS
jgi:predicted permease